MMATMRRLYSKGRSFSEIEDDSDDLSPACIALRLENCTVQHSIIHLLKRCALSCILQSAQGSCCISLKAFRHSSLDCGAVFDAFLGL